MVWGRRGKEYRDRVDLGDAAGDSGWTRTLDGEKLGSGA